MDEDDGQDVDWPEQSGPVAAGAAMMPPPPGALRMILHLPHGRRAVWNEFVRLRAVIEPEPNPWEVQEDDVQLSILQFAERDGVITHEALRSTHVKPEKQAMNRVWQMTITRLRAEGEKWRKWHKVNVGSGKRSYFPKKYQDRKVIRFNDQAEYTIASDILLAYEESLRKIRGDRGGGPSTQSGATPQQVVRTEAKRGRVEDRQQGGQATKAARIQHQPVPFRGTGPTTQTVMDHFMAT